jgi:hypothetical protein
MSISWDYEDFIAEPLCMTAIDPILMGYDTLTRPELFTITYDIRTLITGLSVNLKIVQTEQLEEIKSYASNVVSNGLPISIKYYYDPRYAGMDPIRCARVNGGAPTCFISIGDVRYVCCFNLFVLFSLF